MTSAGHVFYLGAWTTASHHTWRNSNPFPFAPSLGGAARCWTSRTAPVSWWECRRCS